MYFLWKTVVNKSWEVTSQSASRPATAGKSSAEAQTQAVWEGAVHCACYSMFWFIFRRRGHAMCPLPLTPLLCDLRKVWSGCSPSVVGSQEHEEWVPRAMSIQFASSKWPNVDLRTAFRRGGTVEDLFQTGDMCHLFESLRLSCETFIFTYLDHPCSMLLFVL